MDRPKKIPVSLMARRDKCLFAVTRKGPAQGEKAGCSRQRQLHEIILTICGGHFQCT
jgi:hypothetical protein